MDNFDLRKFLAENRKPVNENPQDHSDEEELELDADYDKGGKYYSEDGAEAFRIQPFKMNDIEYTKHEANRMGRYIVGLRGEELKKFISDYMGAWEADKGDTEAGRAFKEEKKYSDYEPGTIAPEDLYYSDKHGKLVALDDVDDKYHDSLELVYKKGDRIEDPMD